MSTLLIVVGLTGGWWALEQTQQVPEFYTRATESLTASTAEASQHLQQEVEQLQNDAARIGSWNAIFSDDQINSPNEYWVKLKIMMPNEMVEQVTFPVSCNP